MKSYSLKRYQPASLRIWHWLNAIAIFGLLGTTLLRKTFLSWRTNSAFIQSQLSEQGIEISSDLAKNIAVGIRNPMWDWHVYFGISLAFLLIGRVCIALCSRNKTESLATHLKNFKNETSNKVQALHKLSVKAVYAIFYLMTTLMVCSGLILTFKAELGFEKSFTQPVKEIHELSMWFFVGFVALHIFGVIFAELTKDRGIVSDMINGGDK